MIAEMTIGKWMVVLLILFLSYIVYGVGFVMRTENNIRSLIEETDMTSPSL